MRKDYMNGKISHREYQAQFVNDNVKRMVIDAIGIERLKKSKDEHFNDIPLHIWDNIGLPYGISEKLKEAGDYYTLAGQVCILKEAGRQLLEKGE
jgi:hypothetical protein